MKESGATRKRVYEQKYTLPSGVQADRVTSTINSDGVLTINAPKGKAVASSMNQTIEQKMDRILSPSNWPEHTNLNTNRTLVDSINTKRSIVDDDLFGDSSGQARYAQRLTYHFCKVRLVNFKYICIYIQPHFSLIPSF